MEKDHRSSIAAELLPEQGFFRIVHHDQILEDHQPVTGEVHVFQILPGRRIRRQSGRGNAVFQLAETAYLRLTVQLIIALRIDHKQNLGGGTGGAGGVLFPHLDGTTDHGAGLLCPIHSTPDIEKPE